MLRQVSPTTKNDENLLELPKVNTTPPKPPKPIQPESESEVEFIGTVASRTRNSRLNRESISLNSQFKGLEAVSGSKKRSHTSRPSELPKPKKEFTHKIKQEVIEAENN